VTSFDVSVERRQDAIVVLVSGQVDINAAPVLRERLIDVFMDAGHGDALVVDLGQVSFIDSTGLGVLVGAHRRAVASSVRMSVVVGPDTRRVIRLTGLDKFLDVVDAPHPS
jgi:anti-sigma B factor antagonist